jgi:hypothetical protein
MKICIKIQIIIISQSQFETPTLEFSGEFSFYAWLSLLLVFTLAAAFNIWVNTNKNAIITEHVMKGLQHSAVVLFCDLQRCRVSAYMASNFRMNGE